MAVWTGSVYSETLRLRTPVELIFPNDEIGCADHPPCAVIFFLHGLTDNFQSYGRWTNVGWLARKYHFVAVMPDAERSWYFDMRYGAHFLTYLGEELRPLLEKMFVLPQRTLLLGNSMGGYGAVKTLLRFPCRFSGAAALSGAYDVERVARTQQELTDEFTAILGRERLLPPSDDVYLLAQRAVDVPPLYLACGLQDAFLPNTKHLEEILERRSASCRAVYDAGGHDWEFWNAHLEDAVRYLLGSAD